jgi:hypothetical protein
VLGKMLAVGLCNGNRGCKGGKDKSGRLHTCGGKFVGGRLTMGVGFEGFGFVLTVEGLADSFESTGDLIL